MKELWFLIFFYKNNKMKNWLNWLLSNTTFNLGIVQDRSGTLPAGCFWPEAGSRETAAGGGSGCSSGVGIGHEHGVGGNGWAAEKRGEENGSDGGSGEQRPIAWAEVAHH